MHRTPIDLKAAMFVLAGTSCGANWWWTPWRAKNATGVGLPVVGLGCSEIVIGDDGLPHGVSMSRHATGWKFSNDSRPVPPITAMRGVPLYVVGRSVEDIL